MFDALQDLFRDHPGVWKPPVEIGILTLTLYLVLRFMRGTRGEGILKGFFLLLVVGFASLMALADSLQLYRLELILDAVLQVSILALIIIFQPELRRGLVRLAGNRWIPAFIKEEFNILDEVVESVFRLARNRVGALIAIEREVGLRTYIEGGVALDSEVSSELLETVFFPGSALHDGAIIMQNQRLAAAGCLFPLTDNPEVSKSLGTRHRAAIGITEEADAIAIVVSEETGAVSLAVDGKLYADLGKEQLETMLTGLYLREPVELPEPTTSKSRRLPSTSKRLTR